MTIAFPCENCGHRFEVDRSYAGKKCRCKKCGHVFVIPVPREPASATAPRPAMKTFGADSAPAPPKSRPSAPAPKPPPAPAPAEVPSFFDDEADPYGLNDAPAPVVLTRHV